jgi:hypothetical protein
VFWFSRVARCVITATPTLKEWLQCRRDLVSSVSRRQMHQHIIANLGPALDFSSFTIFIPEHSLSKHSVSSCFSIAAPRHITNATFRTILFAFESTPANKLQLPRICSGYCYVPQWCAVRQHGKLHLPLLILKVYVYNSFDHS